MRIVKKKLAFLQWRINIKCTKGRMVIYRISANKYGLSTDTTPISITKNTIFLCVKYASILSLVVLFTKTTKYRSDGDAQNQRRVSWRETNPYSQGCGD